MINNHSIYKIDVSHNIVFVGLLMGQVIFD